MKKANLYFLLAVFISVNLFFVKTSYSQWTICGDLAGISGRSTLAVVDENTAYVTGGTAVNATYKTTNGGANWITLNTGTLEIFQALWAKDANTVFAGSGSTFTGTGKLYKTSDGGTTWTAIDSIVGGGFGGVKFSESMPSFGIAVGGDGSNILVFKTRDGGNTWIRSSFPPFPGYDLSISGYNVIDSLFYSMGTTSGSPSIINTANGGATYNLLNINLPSVGGNFTRGIAFNNDKLTGIAGATSLPTISQTTNGGLNWTNVSVGNYAPNTTSPVMRWIEGTNTCYMTSPYTSGGILKSINGGLNWTEMSTSGLGMFNMDTKRIGSTVYGYAVSFSNGSTNTVVKTADPIAGSNKRFFANCITPIPKLFTKGNLSANGVHTTFGPGDSISYGGMEFDNTGKLYCIGNRLNPTLNILDTTTGILTNLGPITGLTTPEQGNPRLAFNTVNNKMYLSIWSTGFVTSYLYSLNLNTREATFIGSGAYNTSDIAINSAGQCYGLANINVLITIDLNTGEHNSIAALDYNSGNFTQGLCFDRETNDLYVTGWNNDSLRAELRIVNLQTARTILLSVFNPNLGRISGFTMPFNIITNIQNISSQIPEGYSLKQNYPNPFNPVTNLEFGISNLGFVTLKIYDILGKEVATLVNAKLSPGTYKYDFDGSNLSSGVYFYKLEADGFVDTKRMALVK